MAIHKKQKSLSQKNKNKSNSKNRKQNKHQRGGFIATTRPNPTMMHSMNQRGGSPASTLVMQDTMNPPVMNDYVTSPRIRESWYDDSLASLEPRCNQMGGSPASDLVMEQLEGVPQTKAYPNGWKVKGDMNSLNLYETTGGSRKKHNKGRKDKKRTNHKSSNHKSRKNNSRSRSRKNKNSKRSRRNNRTRSQRGGASDWIMSQYSLGPNNNPEASTSLFSHSTATPRSEYMNPSSLGLAGSGYPMGALEGANVRSVGAPLS
jgi:hypothetical protein